MFSWCRRKQSEHSKIMFELLISAHVFTENLFVLDLVYFHPLPPNWWIIIFCFLFSCLISFKSIICLANQEYNNIFSKCENFLFKFVKPNKLLLVFLFCPNSYCYHKWTLVVPIIVWDVTKPQHYKIECPSLPLSTFQYVIFPTHKTLSSAFWAGSGDLLIWQSWHCWIRWPK